MDIEFIFKIAAIGIIVAVLNMVLIRSGREEIVHSIIKPHELKECGNGFKFEDKRAKKVNKT